MENNKKSQDLKDIATGLGFEEPTTLEEISGKLGGIENELVLLNEKAESVSLKGIGRLLFLILLALIYIAIKLQ